MFKKTISKLVKVPIDYAVVLGSGYTNTLNSASTIFRYPYSKIKEAKQTSVHGHLGILELIKLGAKYILIFRGRTHLYEGYTPQELTLMLKNFISSQQKMFNKKPIVILTNASGSTNTNLAPGSIVLIKDHINTIWQTPLQGPKFIDMSNIYPKVLRERFIQTAKEHDINVKEAVYAITIGPQYETPAEVRMLKLLGADLLGMSTVPEAILLRSLNIEILAISVVSNFATGISKTKLSHLEVANTVKKTEQSISKLLEGFISD